MSFQEFADAAGVTKNFRMGNRSLAWLCEIYDAWRSVAPPSEWETGPIVRMQRGRGVVNLFHQNGHTVTLKTHR
jgi:hypothetical protein